MSPWLLRLRTGGTIGRLLPMYATYAVLKRVVPLPRSGETRLAGPALPARPCR